MSQPLDQVPSSEHLRRICDQLQSMYKDDPNIIGVGIGPNLVGGKHQGVAVQVTVRQKLCSSEDIEAIGSQSIPPEFDGVTTDVIVAELTQPMNAPTGERGGRQEDPLVGGTSTTVLSDFHYFPTGYGTLGGICFDVDSGAAMAISNAHVWGEETGRTVIQPWMPVDEYVEGAVKLLTCGALISYLAEWTAPSPLTVILGAAAAGAWVATAAADEEDPNRWGQRLTPVGDDVKTSAERITLSADVPQNPMPGFSYAMRTNWDYLGVTDGADRTAQTEQERQNKHVALKRVLTERQQYRGGERVRICAEILGFNADDPLDYFVTARIFPLDQSEQFFTRILRPGRCGIKRPRDWDCFKGFPREWLSQKPVFPLHHGVYKIRGDGDARAEMVQLANPQESIISVRIPYDGGLNIDLPPTTSVSVDVSHTNSPVTVFARDPIGRVVAQASTGTAQRTLETLVLEGQVIQSLTVFGGNGEGWLHGLCYSKPDLPDGEKILDKFRNYEFVGDFDLGLRESSRRWGVTVTVQTVDNSPTDLEPILAAQNIGGLMTAPVSAQLAGCVTVLLLDHVFDVI